MGLLINIYKHNGRDYSASGLTAFANELCVVNAEGPFNPSDKAPAVLLVSGPMGEPVLKPAVMVDGLWQSETGWFMFGGCYGATSDSRFGEAMRDLFGHAPYAAIPIHDRQE